MAEFRLEIRWSLFVMGGDKLVPRDVIVVGAFVKHLILLLLCPICPNLHLSSSALNPSLDKQILRST